MKAAAINFIILGVISGLTSGSGVLPDDLTAAVGGTVTFITTVPPAETPFMFVAWEFNNTSNLKINIITSSERNDTAPEYADRITLFRSTGSLELRNLTLNDSGEYSVNIIPNEAEQITGQTRLNVLAPVSNVKVSVSGTDLVEFNSSVSLSCSSSGSSLSFLWLNGSSEVTATDRVHLSDLNRTVTIVNVSRSDQGSFSCRVSNPVSDGTSESVHLSISYGPDNVGISGPQRLDVDQTLVLFCSAESSPPADYTWTLNDKEMLNSSAVFITYVTTCSDSGTYICQARNELTGRTSHGEHRLSVRGCGGLSAGAIAGIVIACVLVVGGLLAGGLYFYKTNKSALPHSGKSDTSARPRVRKTEQEETVYENDSVIYENTI